MRTLIGIILVTAASAACGGAHAASRQGVMPYSGSAGPVVMIRGGGMGGMAGGGMRGMAGAGMGGMAAGGMGGMAGAGMGGMATGGMGGMAAAGGGPIAAGPAGYDNRYDTGPDPVWSKLAKFLGLSHDKGASTGHGGRSAHSASCLCSYAKDGSIK